MKKLIDLLNELAVAEAETKAIEVEMDENMNEDNEKEYADKWAKAYDVEFNKFKEVVAKLESYGIEAKTARKMLVTKRSELVEVAYKEA